MARSLSATFDDDRLVAEPLADSFRRGIVDAKINLAAICEQGLILSVGKAFFELCRRLIVELQPDPVPTVLVDRVFDTAHVCAKARRFVDQEVNLSHAPSRLSPLIAK